MSEAVQVPRLETYSDRQCTAEETLGRVLPFLDQFGVTRIARHTGLDNLAIPVWCALTPNSKSLVIAQGKGITEIDAKMSAVMEALERAVAGDPVMERVSASFGALQAKGHAADRLPSLVAADQTFLEDHTETEWVSGTNLFTGRTTYVPYEAVLLDRTRRDNRYWMSSDGLASGNTKEEAILHAVLERIERDASVLWKVTSPAKRYHQCVDIDSMGDPVLSAMSANIRVAGLALHLFDITSDIGIPVFAAILGPEGTSSARHIRFVEVASGYGAHPSPVRAALRAVTEAAQSRLTFISGSRDDVLPMTFSRPLPDETRLAFKAAAKPFAASTVAAPEGIVGALYTYVLVRLKAAGVRSAIAVTLSDPSWPFSVAKVFLTELESPEGARHAPFGQRAIAKALFS